MSEVSQKTKDKLAADAAHNAAIFERFPIGCEVLVIRGDKYGTSGKVLKHYKGDYGTRTGNMFTSVLADCNGKSLVLDIDLITPIVPAPIAPLAGGYYDSRDVPAVPVPEPERLCRRCGKTAELPPNKPRYCSLDCVIESFDPDGTARIESQYVKQEIEEGREALIASSDNPLLELMRDRDGWRGMTLIAAERRLRHLLHWYFDYTCHKGWIEP